VIWIQIQEFLFTGTFNN